VRFLIKPLLEVEGLKKHFKVGNNLPWQKGPKSVKAVDGVNLNVYPGETLGIVGESGCGKSTVARLINQLVESTEGKVKFNGKDITNMRTKELRKERKNIQMVFQDPFASLDPRMSVGELVSEPLKIHNVGDKNYRKNKAEEMLEIVGLNKNFASRNPHEFSGGQRQRINIARTLVLEPELVICDEPVSALDVSVQAQIINLLKKLQRELSLTLIFISHDLNVVRYMCERVLVMYLGKVVEVGSYKDIYSNPSHPYTKALLASIPKESPFDKKESIVLKGSIPSPLNPPSGCRFHTRCPFATEICKKSEPSLRSTEEMLEGHTAACHHIEKIKGEEGKLAYN